MADIESNRQDLGYANRELKNAYEDLNSTNTLLYGEDGDSGISQKAKYMASLATQLAELLPQLKDAMDDMTNVLPGLAERVDSAQKLYTSAGMVGQVKESRDAFFATRTSRFAFQNAEGMLEAATSVLGEMGSDVLNATTANTKDINFSLFRIEGGIDEAKASTTRALDIGNSLGESL